MTLYETHTCIGILEQLTERLAVPETRSPFVRQLTSQERLLHDSGEPEALVG